jgi:ribosomal protein S6--L-glutamate ligase
VLGVGVAGVDLMESRKGPLVLEVNSSPGLEGIERATGADVASAVIEHLEREIGAARSQVNVLGVCR